MTPLEARLTKEVEGAQRVCPSISTLGCAFLTWLPWGCLHDCLEPFADQAQDAHTPRQFELYDYFDFSPNHPIQAPLFVAAEIIPGTMSLTTTFHVMAKWKASYVFDGDFKIKKIKKTVLTKLISRVVRAWRKHTFRCLFSAIILYFSISIICFVLPLPPVEQTTLTDAFGILLTLLVALLSIVLPSFFVSKD
ncbi:MAG: hypothetical protein CJBNEKGG_04462 [Prosthecobacter sp.]|nr:hypothetical protein [Prosthecobacter sp.]